MLDLMLATNDILAAGGLQGLFDTAVSDWIRPIFLIFVIALSVMFIRNRAWMQLLTFIAFAAIVGLIVFNAESLFGQRGNISGVAGDLASEINAISVLYLPKL